MKQKNKLLILFMLMGSLIVSATFKDTHFVVYAEELPVVENNDLEGTSEKLSVQTFATKEQLSSVFSAESEKSIVSYLNFGKYPDGNTARWLIVGNNKDNQKDNVVLFNSSFFDYVKFSENVNKKTYTDSTGNTVEVWANHYGASDLYKTYEVAATNKEYFSMMEQAMMLPTTVVTYDKMNDTNYETTSVLYAPNGEYMGDIIWAGAEESDGLKIHPSHWGSWHTFFLRNPYLDSNGEYKGDMVLRADSGNKKVYNRNVNSSMNQAAVFDLNTNNVLFASAAKSLENQNSEWYDTLEDLGTRDNAMSLRLDGQNDEILAHSNAYFTEDKIICDLSNNWNYDNNISLTIQGKTNEKDWYYSTLVQDDKIVTNIDIQNKLNLEKTPDLSDCKIWLERKGEDSLYYAKAAEVLKYNVFYTFESGTKDKDLPDEIIDLIPRDTMQYNEGDTISAISPTKREITVSDGVWKFEGYDSDSKIANKENVDETGNITFTGTWKFYLNASIINTIPTINASDKTITVGEKFDPLKDVTATDKEDGNITLTIDNVIDNKVDTSKAGAYTVTYKVTDSKGASSTKTIKVAVKEKETPVVPVDPDKPNTDKPNNDKGSVETGDQTNVGLFTSLSMISALGIAVLVVLKKKKALDNK